MHAPQTEDLIRMTEAEYLAFEENSDVKHEYSRGQIYDMTGGSVRHAVITGNIMTQLNIQLAERDCIVTSPDARVHIATKGAYRYPDVTVVCGELALLPGRNDTIINPIVLVEVLSPGTALQDHNEKLDEYVQIETLQVYLLVAQARAHVQRYLRQESGSWLYDIATDMDVEIALPPIDCALALSKIYQKVNFDPVEDGA